MAGAVQSGSQGAMAESCMQGIQQDQGSMPCLGIAEGKQEQCGVVAGGGVASGDGVAYIVDNQIKAVGKN